MDIRIVRSAKQPSKVAKRYVTTQKKLHVCGSFSFRQYKSEFKPVQIYDTLRPEIPKEFAWLFFLAQGAIKLGKKVNVVGDRLAERLQIAKLLFRLSNCPVGIQNCLVCLRIFIFVTGGRLGKHR
ncbi:hypothetical protein DCO57_04435 [Labrenzia sp. 011]|nr:hypothetical protein DCO57_04435 [Labrenzia sp. 011]